ncbi:phytanoyl-CoA dioxygenase family protein [Paenibacillus filicis]|uniref:Phytanoyl-CoA dioxygenase family protein n=1 Tax=Paenibacillus gyeongsangnamensis TaxID=3388067 RepID=A0ABT4Q3R5_9BACL|nr:phytanoyl-CoA dioxygenase family protein [Paenibacillus filicis]MCZ8511487.1 phytanoyl-CoA dioxygenase family protein [Paenibacillus filicis]
MIRSLQEHIDEFHKQGYTLMKGALQAQEAESLKEGVLKAMEGPGDGYRDGLRTRMFEKGEQFQRLIMQPGVVDFAEAVLGPKCHMFAMNAHRTARNGGIDNWHVDEELFFPLPEGVEFDPRMQMPTFLITCIYYLVDVTETMGPTQVIPGSHRSGQEPDPNQNPPIYKGQEPVTILAKQGDCLLFTGQLWHRGARNESDEVRIVQQVMYGKRWISQRFYPFVNYQLPQEIVERWKDHPRMSRLLGMHQRGPYG